MSAKPACACDRFARLEGASATAYAKSFLVEQPAPPDDAAAKRFRCRECGRLWERRASEINPEGTRPSLVRID